jgi:hypothetical protein
LLRGEVKSIKLEFKKEIIQAMEAQLIKFVDGNGASES